MVKTMSSPIITRHVASKNAASASSAIESLSRKRQEIKSKIIRLNTYLDSFDISTQSVQHLKCRYETGGIIRNDHEKVVSQLMEIVNENEIDSLSLLVGEFDESYYSLTDFRRKL